MTAFQPGDRVHFKGHAHAPATTGTVTEVRIMTIVFVQWDDSPAITPHHPQHLEPAGEPMSKTFKSATYEGCELTINQIPSGSYVRTKVDGIGVSKFIVSPDDAPALALAILEAVASTGAPLAPEVARAMEALEEYKQRIQTEAEDAADREVLETEAWELYKARTNGSTFDSFHDLERGTQAEWTAVAKHARTMHGVTK